MKSIYLKNFIYSAGMVIMCFLILAVVFVFLCRSFLSYEKRENMNATASQMAKSVRSLYIERTDLTIWELQMNINQISIITGNHIFVCDRSGRVVNCSDKPGECSHIGSIIPATVMQMLSAIGKLDVITDLAGFYPSAHYVVALPVLVETSDAAVGYVFVSSDSSTLMDAWRNFLKLFAGTAGAILIIAVVMSYFASKQQAKPINEMAAAARQFARGDFSARVEETCREDEIGALTASFNAMAKALERSEELRSEFIANVSHELKTPMTTISGFADGLLDGTIPKESQDKYLLTISDETKRLSRLVRRMLELSTIKTSGTENVLRRDFDITETVKRSLVNFESKIMEKGLDVDIQLPENSIIVLGDEDSITQVVYNLLDNAIKFSERGSVISLSLWHQGGKAYVSVKNKGETIPEKDIQHIFERFHKTDRSRSRDRDGVGLGLYIVKTILGNHNEDIRASSHDGVTEFVFSLTIKPSGGRNVISAKQAGSGEINNMTT